MKQAKAWLTVFLWLAVPFPTYLGLVFLAQPTLYELVYGVPFLYPIPAETITLTTSLIVLSSTFAIVVVGAIVGVVSWGMAKEYAPIGGGASAC